MRRSEWDRCSGGELVSCRALYAQVPACAKPTALHFQMRTGLREAEQILKDTQLVAVGWPMPCSCPVLNRQGNQSTVPRVAASQDSACHRRPLVGRAGQAELLQEGGGITRSMWGEVWGQKRRPPGPWWGCRIQTFFHAGRCIPAALSTCHAPGSAQPEHGQGLDETLGCCWRLRAQGSAVRGTAEVPEGR